MSAIAIFSSLLAVASAITVPGGSNPTGPAIYQPGLNSVVPAGQGFTITWDKTNAAKCGDTVDLVLLYGKSAATMQAISYIAQKTTNNGSLAWTPSTSLAPSDTGYGIELICDKSQAYQYTTQFGISNAHYVAHAVSMSSSSTMSSASTSAAGAGAASAKVPGTGVAQPVYTTEVVTSLTTFCPAATQFAINNKTYTVSKATTLTITNCPCTLTKAINATVATPAVAYGNSSSTKSSGSVTKPSSVSRSATLTSQAAAASTTASASSASASASASSTRTGAAAQFGASIGGLAIAAGVAVFAF